MLGYAVETRPARRKASPTTLALIVAGHAALILAVVNSRMDLPERPRDPPTWIDWIEVPIDPAPIPPEPQSPANPTAPQPTPLDPLVEIPIPLPGPQIELGPPQPIPTGPGTGEIPADPPKPLVRLGPKPAHSRPRTSSALSRGQAPTRRGSGAAPPPRDRRARPGPLGRRGWRCRSDFPCHRAQPFDSQLALHPGERGRSTGSVVDRHHLALQA